VIEAAFAGADPKPNKTKPIQIRIAHCNNAKRFNKFLTGRQGTLSCHEMQTIVSPDIFIMSFTFLNVSCAVLCWGCLRAAGDSPINPTSFS